MLRADLLVPWARWITPEGEPRRFDARFFAAALPDGQEAVGHEAEADHVAWLRPADAIDSAKAGEISLLPPTATTLERLRVRGRGRRRASPTSSATRRVIEPVQPRLVLEDGTAWLVIPDGVGYPAVNEIRPAAHRKAVSGMGTARAWCVLAPNPSPMTLDGTNTWVIAEPGSSAVLVVDPGPDDEGHLRRVLDVASAGGRRVTQIVLTHGHLDHSAGAARFAELTGAPVGALDPGFRLGTEGYARRRP